jgi:hypothetical protein
MAIGLDHKQVVSFEELLLSQVAYGKGDTFDGFGVERVVEIQTFYNIQLRTFPII